MLALLAASILLWQPGAKLPKSAPAADRQIALDLKVHGDAAALAANPGIATRSGRVLRIGDLRFVDEGECDGSGCERYRFDRMWPGGYAGISLDRDETSDYWLVKAPSEATAIGTKPIASPTGRYLFVGFLDELSGTSATGLPDSIAIWQIDRPGLGLTRIRLIDLSIVAFDTFVAWHGDNCVAFTGNRGDGRTPPESRHFWLVEERLDWVLHDTQPAACTDRSTAQP
jgi:hypothetical protein